MDSSKTVGIGRSPRLATALHIVVCASAAIWLTAVAYVVLIRVMDWIGVR